MRSTIRKAAVGAALVATAFAAHAQSSLWYGVNVGDEYTGNIAGGPWASLPDGVFSTGGVQSVQAGPSTASVSAVADPTTGMFKSFSQVVVNAGSATGSGSAASSLVMRDTLTFAGPGSTVDVTFTFHWDAIVTGQDIAATRRQGDVPYVATQMFSSSQSLRFLADAPAGGSGPCNGEPFCELGASAPLTEPPRPANEVWGWVFSGTENVVVDGVGDGRYSGETTRSFTVAVGTPIELLYVAQNSVQCAWVTECDLRIDSTHSDYIGLSVSDGGSYASAQGYRYLGIDAATAPVPEPATGVLALLGLAALARRRLRSAD